LSSYSLLYIFFFLLIIRPPPTSTLFPYTTLFRSDLIRKMSKKNRRNIRKEIIPFLETYQMECKQHLCSNDLDKAYNLYVHVNKKDRKSTRLNSSHVKISYAVFCLKKKKKTKKTKK